MDDTTEPTVDRIGLEVLDPEECWELLARTPVGRVAFVDAGEPAVLPVTHRVVGRRIVFLSQDGSKLDAARMAPAVAFEVDDWDPATRTGWSVLVRGVAGTAPDDAAVLDAQGLEPWIDPGLRGTWIEIRAHEVTGRRLGG